MRAPVPNRFADLRQGAVVEGVPGFPHKRGNRGAEGPPETRRPPLLGGNVLHRTYIDRSGQVFSFRRGLRLPSTDRRLLRLEMTGSLLRGLALLMMLRSLSEPGDARNAEVETDGERVTARIGHVRGHAPLWVEPQALPGSRLYSAPSGGHPRGRLPAF
jgi:hypothetical protein